MINVGVAVWPKAPSMLWGAVTLVTVAVLACSGCGSTTPHSEDPEIIGHGRTFAGSSFVARLRRTDGCPLSVAIKESRTFGSHGLCYSNFENPERPKVECLLGLLAIHMRVLNATRSVRLRLSDGQTVTSPAMVLPRRLGGPAALYYQVVRGPNPIPVLLTELDVQDRPLQTMAIRHVVECTEQLGKRPGRTYVLAKDQTPSGKDLSSPLSTPGYSAERTSGCRWPLKDQKLRRLNLVPCGLRRRWNGKSDAYASRMHMVLYMACSHHMATRCLCNLAANCMPCAESRVLSPCCPIACSSIAFSREPQVT